MRSEPSGSLNDTRRSAPLRATSADNEGMPMVFWPPSVSALKTRTARYFSGSRAALTVDASGEGLAVTIVGEVLALADVFVFVVSDLWQALRASPSKLTSSNEANR